MKITVDSRTPTRDLGELKNGDLFLVADKPLGVDVYMRLAGPEHPEPPPSDKWVPCAQLKTGGFCYYGEREKVVLLDGELVVSVV